VKIRYLKVDHESGGVDGAPAGLGGGPAGGEGKAGAGVAQLSGCVVSGQHATCSAALVPSLHCTALHCTALLPISGDIPGHLWWAI
jgi:hypothetical protein